MKDIGLRSYAKGWVVDSSGLGFRESSQPLKDKNPSSPASDVGSMGLQHGLSLDSCKPRTARVHMRYKGPD